MIPFNSCITAFLSHFDGLFIFPILCPPLTSIFLSVPQRHPSVALSCRALQGTVPGVLSSLRDSACLELQHDSSEPPGIPSCKHSWVCSCTLPGCKDCFSLGFTGLKKRVHHGLPCQHHSNCIWGGYMALTAASCLPLFYHTTCRHNDSGSRATFKCKGNVPRRQRLEEADLIEPPCQHWSFQICLRTRQEK